MLEIFDRGLHRVAIAENAHAVTEDQKINTLWYLNFSLPYSDPKNKYCIPFFYVRYNGGELYRIMPAAETIGESGDRSYQCEHVLATLLDNVLFGYHVVGNIGHPTRETIQYVLDHQLESHWVLDRCDFSRQFEYGWEQENLLAALFSIASPLTGYMWKTDTTVYPWRLSLIDIGVDSSPALYVRAAWNLLSYEETVDPQQICTRLYPLGYGEGVNQLNISSINNGVPYLQSPQKYIDRYGTVERIWIDRRYEDVESLKSAAQVMLNELQEPVRQFKIGFAELDSSDYNTAAVGKKMRLYNPETNEPIDTYVTEIRYNHDEIQTSELTVANKNTSIASSVADLADRQRIEQAYAQGATQLYAQNLQANCDKEKGAEMSFYIPEDMRIINKVVAKVKISQFRAYSKATTVHEQNIYSSSSTNTSAYSSSAGGGMAGTTEAGGSQTSSSTELVSSTTEHDSNDDGGPGGANHNHGLSRGDRLALVDYSLQIIGSRDFYPSGKHVHPAHTHEIAAHSHLVNIPAHSHSFTIPGHSHQISIPRHGHDITPGIYYYGSANGFSLFVNGVLRGAFQSTGEDIDLTAYLEDAVNKRIPRGSWLTIEVRPNDLAYVCIDLYVQGFVQSRGDRTV